MYLKHFGLTEMPFGITPDTSFTYLVQYHQEALNTLLLALNEGEGFVKISGEVGTGKTLLCRRLLQTLNDGWVTAYSHLRSTNVRMEQRVTQGQVIGSAGASGGVSQPQVHFEIRYTPAPADRPRPVDPLPLLPR